MNNIVFFFGIDYFSQYKSRNEVINGELFEEKITFLFSLFAILDSFGRYGESCVLTLLRMVGKGKGCYRRRRARDRRGDLCTRRTFYVVGVGNGMSYW